jgi:hypothetical protein
MARSKWNNYGPYFVTVLSLAAAHYSQQLKGVVPAEAELIIDYRALLATRGRTAPGGAGERAVDVGLGLGRWGCGIVVGTQTCRWGCGTAGGGGSDSR